MIVLDIRPTAVVGFLRAKAIILIYIQTYVASSLVICLKVGNDHKRNI